MPGAYDSLRAAARAAQSPRLWTLLVTLSGWAVAAWSGAVWVAGLRAELEQLTRTVAELPTQCATVNDELKRSNERHVRALRVVLAELGRTRSKGPDAVRSAAAAAVGDRFDQAMLRGVDPAQAAAAALATP